MSHCNADCKQLLLKEISIRELWSSTSPFATPSPSTGQEVLSTTPSWCEKTHVFVGTQQEMVAGYIVTQEIDPAVLFSH